MSTMGKRIRLLRNELKLSQEQFGAIFNSGKSYISAVENDKSKLSVDNLVKLLVDYDVNLNFVMGGIGEPFNTPKYESVKDEIMDKVRKMLEDRGIQ